MTALVGLAIASDLALLSFLVIRVRRSWARGVSLRIRLFLALSGAMLAGALVTGVYATAVDTETLGFTERFAQVLPKGFLVASGLWPLLAAVAAAVGARLARPLEELSDAAVRIAEGEPALVVRSGRGAEAQRLGRALVSMRRSIEDKPYAAAFLRDAWHDLKTPLAAIVATLEVLQDGALEDGDAARRFLANLRRSADQLDRRLSDLVTLSRYETAALRRSEPADLRELASRALEPLAELAAARSVDVALDPDTGHSSSPRVLCDESALSRALQNLVENGIKASPGGTVRVRVDGGGAREVTIEVTNEPASVPEAQRASLFERAATSDPDRTRGSGLGLAIARAAVESQGGTIRFAGLGPPRVTVRIDLPRG